MEGLKLRGFNFCLNGKISTCMILGFFYLMMVPGYSICKEVRAELVDEPLHKLYVSIGINMQESFFSYLREFSDRHAFAIRIAPNALGGKSYTIQMWREDIKIVAVNSFDDSKFRVYFYKNSAPSLGGCILETLIENLSNGFMDKGFIVNRTD